MTAGDLDGRRIVVTGAAKGIGHATVATLLARGASVAAIDLEAPGELWDGLVVGLAADVSDETSIGAAVDAAAEALGGLDGVVNNAGVMLEKPTPKITASEFDRVIGVNLRGTFLVGRAALRHFRPAADDTAKPRIVNIASELAYLGRAEYSAYCASKGGVISLTRAWARELAPHVLVNAVAPGPTDTDMLRAESNYTAWTAADGIPLGRVGRPEDVARMVAVMLGPDSRFMTGQIVGVNGGAVMQ